MCMCVSLCESVHVYMCEGVCLSICLCTCVSCEYMFVPVCLCEYMCVHVYVL